jgi:hypothetical protein
MREENHDKAYGFGFSAFSLLLCTGKHSEVRLFLRKSRAEFGCPVYTRSEML